MIAAEDIVITATNPVEFSAGSIISDSNISVDKNETWVGTGGYTNIGLIQTGEDFTFSDTQSIFAKTDFNRVSASGTVSVSLGGNGGFSAGHIFADADTSFTTRDGSGHFVVGVLEVGKILTSILGILALERLR